MPNTIKFDRNEFAENYRAKHHGYEVTAYKIFKRALIESVQPLLDSIERYGFMTSMLVLQEPMQRAYKEVYTKVGLKHAQYTYRWINRLGASVKDEPVSFYNEKWAELLEQFYYGFSAELIQDVTDTTRERIQDILARNQFLTLTQQAELIAQELGQRDYFNTRAMMIARTESTRISNYAATIANADADYETVKEWIAVLDSRTRPDHTAADGQQVAPNGMFSVGGNACRFPGDVMLPADESINCRCTLAFVPVLDGDGLPVLR